MITAGRFAMREVVPPLGGGLGHQFGGSSTYQKFVTRPDPPSSDGRFGPLAPIAKVFPSRPSCPVPTPRVPSRPSCPVPTARGAPGILPVYQKKDPHPAGPAGDEVFYPRRGSYPHRIDSDRPRTRGWLGSASSPPPDSRMPGGEPKTVRPQPLPAGTFRGRRALPLAYRQNLKS